MPNQLAEETSPYLLQHSDNPVNWYPWGEQALERARVEDKPLLVSIGYSACHWCHVMERESFEDADTASYMNEHFICIKVDREERPDVDGIYMEACQAMTGHGGWPLNAFLTPEQVPIYVGTYFPPTDHTGMPSWRRVLEAVVKAWTDRREELRQNAAKITDRLQGAALLEPSQNPIDEQIADEAIAGLVGKYDSTHGGFTGAPKFPPASAIEFLFQKNRIAEARHTLEAMASGGIYDQIGGGFCRYSTDERWLVPHFEKMLYDNALLARSYLHGWQLTGDELFRRVCTETLDWMLREMQAPEGGFYSAIDAESEGVEGKFYLWSADELTSALGDLADTAIAYFGATEEGNFEGENILVRAQAEPEAIDEIKRRLYEVRSKRIWPATDDKRLLAWNALCVSALADAGATLSRTDYVEAACDCASFLLAKMRDDQGRLLRTYKDGQAKLNAYLEDHAFLVEALITLYEATFDPYWFEQARSLADAMIERFSDTQRGGFFDTSKDHETLVARRKDLEDHPTPAGNSSAAYGLLRLARLTADHGYEEKALEIFQLLQRFVTQYPQAFSHLLQAIDFYIGPVKEVAVTEQTPTGQLTQVVRSAFRPHVVLAGGKPDGVPLLEGRTDVDGKPAAYVCEHFACKQPVTDPKDLEAALR
jgi:uncharacterized protein YyaL (SSP411 family)